MNSSREELEGLLIEWEAGTLDEAGIARVRQLLRTSEEARAHYVQQQLLDAALRLEAAAGLDDDLDDGVAPGQVAAARNVSQQQVKRRRRWFEVRPLLVILGGLLLCALVGRLTFLELKGPTIQPRLVAGTGTLHRDDAEEATSQGVALVTRLVDVVWPLSQTPREVGDALPPGRFAIASGYAQIEFYSGATVIVEGPAELDLASALEANVQSGRLRAHVPPAARGFSLAVDGMKVVDLGTEFGLSVSSEGANVQVFDGEVELHPESKQVRRLTAGAGVVRTPGGEYENTNVVSDEFLDIAALESRARGQRERNFDRWLAWSKQLRSDPRLIAYYAFDEPGDWERRLGSSLQPDNEELDGAIVGADQIPGRWPSKGALEFKHPGDRVCVQIPGEFNSLTFSCWVRIDSLDRWYNSLFLTDNYNLGEPHWQILDTGQLFFSVRVKDDDGRGPEHREVLSPSFWNPSLSGKWLHLATTYDVDEQLVTHYLDGKVLHREEIPSRQIARTTRIGRATIGNWSSPMRPDAHFAIRNLNGSIDEFAIFSAALSPDEIQEIYEHGKP